MRKKLLLTTVIIIMLCCCIATSFAIDNSSVSASDEANTFEMNIVSPSSMYMPLVLPQLVAVNSDYTAVVSVHELSVYYKGDYTKIATTSQEGYHPKSVAIVGQNLLIMYESAETQSTYLNLWDLATGTEINADFQSVLGEGKEPKAIDDDQSKFYMHNTANELIAMTVKDGIAIGEKVNVSVNVMARAAAFDMSEGQLYTYNGQSIGSVHGDKLTAVLPRMGILKFNVAEDGIMIVYDGKIGFYSTKSQTDLIPYDANMSNSAYYYAGNIYFCDSVAARVKVLSLDSTVADSGKYYGDSGNEIGRYNAPQDLAVSGGSVYVADTNNKRVSIFDSNTHAVTVASLGEITPLKIAVNGENIAIYDGVSVGFYKYIASNLTLVNTLPMSQYGKIISIIYHYDQLVALTDVGAIYNLGATATKIHELTGGKQIISNSNSNHIYIVADKLMKFNMKTYVQDVEYEFDSANMSSIVVDYAGTIFGIDASGKNLSAYNRDMGVYSKGKTFALDRLSINSRFTMDMQSGDIYIIDKDMHKLVRVSARGIGAKSLNDIGYEHVGIESWTVIEAAAIKSDTYLYTAPNNDEAVEDISAGSVYLVLSYAEYNGEQYAYGCVKGAEKKFYYVKANQLEMYSKVEYASNHPTMIAVFPSGADIKQFPVRSAKTIANAKRPTEILLINNVAGEYNNHIWQWYKVSYKGDDGAIVIGYVEKDDVYYTSAITPPKNRIFLKVQTEGLGKTVSLYKEPNAQSEVLFSNVSDGEKVILGTEKFDNSAEFTKVVYNNTIGYIYTANLLQSGMTTSQVATIVVSVVCVVIFIILIVLLILRKKLFNKASGKMSKSKNTNNMQ